MAEDRRKSAGPAPGKAARKRVPSARQQAPSRTPKAGDGAAPFPVVGIGASAGGLEALMELLEHVPPDTGMAFVVITHQHAGHTSLLPELLGKATAMPVREATDGVALAPNTITLSPPGGHLATRNARLYFMEPPAKDSLRLPIDYFFRSLASDQHERAICIVLSGTGSDGTLGLKAIKGEAGMAMVQQPQTAKYSGMPSSAVATGLADYVLPIAAMPAQLMGYASGAYARERRRKAELVPPSLTEPLAKIFLLLQMHTGHDFSAYKLNTVSRRVERRMHVHQFSRPAEYLRYLQDTPSEIDILFRELLINVTRFFRDGEVYESLLKDSLPQYLGGLAEHSVLRIWVPGCSSGEEVYSLAIVLHEYMTRSQRHFGVQIFGTDLDNDAIETARRGLYPEGIAADVSEARLQRYFTHEDGSYRISKEIRRMAIFAPQSLIRDPPFTRLDLLSCRNVLIYMNAELQQQLLATFCYALKPGALMMLGTSETLGQADGLFDTLDKKWKLFRRKVGPLAALPEVSRFAQARGGAIQDLASGTRDHKVLGLIERLLLARYCPTSIVFNERGDIIHVQGRTGALLEPAEGRPRMNVLEMAREGLKRPLAHAMRRIAANGNEVVSENLAISPDNDGVRLDMSVVQIHEPEPLRGLLLASFRPSSPAAGSVTAVPRPRRSSRVPDYVGELERELKRATESLQSTVEELETANEELISANEEAQSTNEELQSSNEELETSQEELQSLNEELHAVNAELRLKIEQLSQASDDMQNLLDSTNIATVFLDRHLHIKRYTESARRLVRLIPGDIGRPIGDLQSQLKYPDMVDDCNRVLESLEPRVSEIETFGGAWYQVRILPYRTMDHAVGGLVLTFDDIDALKQAQRAAAVSQSYFESVVNTVRELLLVMDHELRVVRASRSFYRLFKLEPAAVEGRMLHELAGHAWDVPQLRTQLSSILPDQAGFDDYLLEHDFPGLGPRRLLLNARRLQREPGLPGMILLSMEALTDAAPVAGPAR